MSFFDFFKKSNELEIGKNISWKESVNMIFKISEFDRNGTIIDNSGNPKAKSSFKPYGYLLVENPNIQSKLRLPIIHRDDFLLAESVFNEPQLSELVKSQDFLVTYRPKIETENGLAGIHHALHYVITPNGTLNNYHKNYGTEKNMAAINSIFIVFSWSEIRVQINKNPKF